MNPWTAQALASSRHNDLRHQAADGRRGTEAKSHPAQSHQADVRQSGPATRIRSRLTEHLGHTLVEAGLHLLAATTPRS
jgi:hypothetical protein